MLTFLVGGQMERYHAEDLVLCGKIILKLIFRRYHVEDLVLCRKIILKLIFRKWDGKAGTGLLWLRIGTDSRRL
jgi:hypothetical protein